MAYRCRRCGCVMRDFVIRGDGVKFIGCPECKTQYRFPRPKEIVLDLPEDVAEVGEGGILSALHRRD